MKKLLITFLLFFSCILIGCIGDNKKVNIKSLSAERYEISELDEKPSKQLKLAKRIITEDDTEPKTDKEVNSPVGQYIIIYKTEKDIKFTIKLDNPKGEAIDAIQITCDDPNSMILVDGEYKKIQFDETNSRILNWAQEDPYEKVFYIQTTSMDDVNTIRIIDIKVNGAWQNKELDRDELKVYKMNNDDLKWTFIRNKIEEYVWKFEYSDKINNVKTYFNGNEIIADENGEYRVKSNGVIEYAYDYTYDGVTLRWNEKREIELLKIKYTPIPDFQVSGAQVQLRFWIIAGTNVDRENIIVIYKNIRYTFHIYKTSYGYSFFEFPSKNWPTEKIELAEYNTTIVIIGGVEYTVEEIFKLGK